MTSTPASRPSMLEVRYAPGRSGRLAAGCWTTALLLAAFAAFLAYASVVGEAWWGLAVAAIFVGAAAFYVRRAFAVPRELDPSRVALGVSPDGLVVGGSALLPWHRIDLVLIDGRVGGHGALNSLLLQNALLGVNHIRVQLGVDGLQSAEAFKGAYDIALPHGRDDFIAIARALREAAAHHPHVRLRISQRFQGAMERAIGPVQAYSGAEEMALGAQRGLAAAEADRAQRHGA
ncbi:hypothetical protein [Demequina subtropica]|uniref:hypothetical protein n=1 Tax=Demequina subtropica TaxID=1638989 RepID=UPI00078416A1|nr:hypothetical protein [Demequina subtropica]